MWNSRTRPLDLRSNAPGWSCLRYNALPLFLLICVYFLNRQISDLTVTVPFVFISPFFFFKPFDLNQTALMICFVIKSRPPDLSDGPDLICLSQTHWPILLNRFDPPRAQFTNRPVFSCLSPIFSTVLLNTPLFFIFTPFFLKNLFSLCFLSL